jgi:hypothetical protein
MHSYDGKGEDDHKQDENEVYDGSGHLAQDVKYQI